MEINNKTNVINFVEDKKIKLVESYKSVFNYPTFSIIKKMWNNSIYFIIFSFLNISLPIIICLISASLDSYGAYAAMGIGYVTTFQMAFSQVGFSFAIFSSFFYFKILRKKQYEFSSAPYDLIYDILFLAFLYGLIITPIYIGSAYVYTKYANAHYNTIDSLSYANDFIFSSWGYVFLVTILYSLVMVLHNKKGQLHAIIYLFFIFGLIAVLSSVLGILTDLKGTGVGLGMTLAILIGTIIAYIDCYFVTNVFRSIKFRINSVLINLILSYTWRPSLTTLSIQIFKGCALLLLSFQIPDALKNSVPLDYQMSRIIWYNIMYFVPFIFLGIVDATYFFFIKEGEKILDGVNKNFILIFNGIIILILTVILTIIGTYLVQGLSIAYTRYQNHTYNNDEISKNLQMIGKIKVINFINNSVNLTASEKIEFIKLINSIPEYELNKILAPILEKTILPKFVSFSSTNIDNMLIFPNSFSYFYLCFYCILYPLGQYMDAFSMAITKEKQKAFLLIIAEGLAILFVVEFGIKYQETQRFYLMEAWSFPLLIIGIIAFAYLSISCFISLSKYDKQQAQLKYLKLQQKRIKNEQ